MLKKNGEYSYLLVHDDETKKRISNTQKNNVKNNKSNLLEIDTCRVCGFTTQKNMIIRHHNENCIVHRQTWQYVSPKVRNNWKTYIPYKQNRRMKWTQEN